MNNLIENVKKIFAALLSVFTVLFSLGGEKIAMDIQVEYEPEQSIRVEWTNYTGTVIYVPTDFSVEKQTDGEWEPIVFADDYAFRDILSVVYPLQGGTFSFRSEEAFGKQLSDGTYRFCLAYGTVSGEKKVAHKEFII